MKRIVLLALAAGAALAPAAPASAAVYCTHRPVTSCLEEDTGQDLQWFCDLMAVTEPNVVHDC